MYCKYCGARLKDGASYCMRCGQPILEQRGRSGQEKKQPEAKKISKKVPKKVQRWCVVAVVVLISIISVAIGIDTKPKGFFINPEKKLIGTWYEVREDGSIDYEDEMTFFSDGTFIGGGEDGRYSVVDGKLIFRFEWVVSKFVYTYDFYFKGNELHICQDDGEEGILRKK